MQNLKTKLFELNLEPSISIKLHTLLIMQILKSPPPIHLHSSVDVNLLRTAGNLLISIQFAINSCKLNFLHWFFFQSMADGVVGHHGPIVLQAVVRETKLKTDNATIHQSKTMDCRAMGRTQKTGHVMDANVRKVHTVYISISTNPLSCITFHVIYGCHSIKV